MNYLIHDWMIKDMGLRGSELLVFALVYSYSRCGSGVFFGTTTFAADITGLTKRTVISTLQRLVESGNVKRSEGYHDGKPTIDYVAVKNFHSASEKISPEAVKNFHSDTFIIHNEIHNTTPNGDSVITGARGREEDPIVSFTTEGGKEVTMKRSEHLKLVRDFGEAETREAVNYLSAYKVEKAYKTKSDYLSLRRWVFDALAEKKRRAASPVPSTDPRADARARQARINAAMRETRLNPGEYIDVNDMRREGEL